MYKIVANIGGRFHYTCRKCGKTELGTRVTKLIEAETLEDLVIQLGKMQKKGYDMPYGWSCHYGQYYDYYNCGCDR